MFFKPKYMYLASLGFRSLHVLGVPPVNWLSTAETRSRVDLYFLYIQSMC